MPSNPLIDVNGQRFWVSGPEVGGRAVPALRVVRENSRQEHGETGLIRDMNNLDVSGFRHLWLKAMVRVDSASLSGGGYIGSEYPMMLRMTYEGPRRGPSLDRGPSASTSPTRTTGPCRPAAPSSGRSGEWKQYEVDLMDTEPDNIPYRLARVLGDGPGPQLRRAGRGDRASSASSAARRGASQARAAWAPWPTSRTTLKTSRMLSRRLMMRLRRSSRGTSTVVQTVAV